MKKEENQNAKIENYISTEKIIRVIFVFFVFIIFIQSFINIIEDKNIRMAKIIDEKEKLVKVAASNIESPYYPQVNPSHRWEVIKALSELKDTAFCRIVEKSGRIYLSSKSEEIDKYVTQQAIGTKDVVTIDDIWNGKLIKVTIAPSCFNNYTVWLGYDLDKVTNQLNEIIFKQIKISFIMLLILLVYLLSFQTSNSNRFSLRRKKPIKNNSFFRLISRSPVSKLVEFFTNIDRTESSLSKFSNKLLETEISAQNAGVALTMLKSKTSELIEVIMVMKTFIEKDEKNRPLCLFIEQLNEKLNLIETAYNDCITLSESAKSQAARINKEELLIKEVINKKASLINLLSESEKLLEALYLSEKDNKSVFDRLNSLADLDKFMDRMNESINEFINSIDNWISLLSEEVQ